MERLNLVALYINRDAEYSYSQEIGNEYFERTPNSGNLVKRWVWQVAVHKIASHFIDVRKVVWRR